LWSVHLRDRIGAVPEAVAFDQAPTFLGTWTTVQGIGGTELAYQRRPLNLGSLTSTGIDLEASAHQSTPWGQLETRLLATTILREDAHNYAGGPTVSRLGDAEYEAATLRWRGRWATSLSQGAWTNTLTLHFQSGYRAGPATVELLDDAGQPTLQFDTVRLKVKPQVTWDWLTSWQVREGWRLTLGMVNLLDTKPPLSLALAGQTKGQMVGYDERYFDARGRRVFAEARLAF
jgi:iron complex outermembrane recepter protein